MIQWFSVLQYEQERDTAGSLAREIIGAVSAVIMDLSSCPAELPRPPSALSQWLGGPTPTAMYIKTLGVRDGHRRRGIAKGLVMACEDHAIRVGGQNCGLLWLHVIAYNTVRGCDGSVLLDHTEDEHERFARHCRQRWHCMSNVDLCGMLFC